MLITSKKNEAVKKITSLKEKKYRELHGLFFVEGIKTVSEALKFNLPVETLCGTEEMLQRFNFENKTAVSKEVYGYISDEVSPAGILAVIKIKKPVLEKTLDKSVLLDGISDCGNLGTIIRTAAAAGYKQVFLINCADVYNPKTVRSSASGIFHADVYEISCNDLEKIFKGVTLLAADVKGVNLFEFKKSLNKFCLCFGSEANGLSPAVKSHAEHIISIPMEKSSESLNAAVAAGIFMYYFNQVTSNR